MMKQGMTVQRNGDDAGDSHVTHLELVMTVEMMRNVLAWRN
jgi:hypothetical protein